MGITMMESSALIAILVAIATVTFKTIFGTIGKNLPPGPRGLPIIGYLHKICLKPLHMVMNDLAKTYGDIFCLQLGSRLTVVLNSREAIYEAFVKKAKPFGGRPDFATFNKTRRGCTGISMCDFSADYKRNRQMCVKALHQLFGEEKHFDHVMEQETQKMVELFKYYATEKQSFDPADEFYRIVPSVVVNIMFGKNFSYNDKDLADLVNLNKIWFESAEANNPADFFKILEHFPNKRLKAIEKSAAAFYDFILKKIEDHDSSNKGLLQYYLYFYGNFHGRKKQSREENMEIARVMADILGGGFDTAAITLSWALLYLSKQPDIIKKCRDEILEVVGYDQIHSLHENKLPYFSATVYDIIRISTTAPLGLPRCTTEDVHVRGYIIPKGTMVLANLWSVNNDSANWIEAKQLTPENFLDNDGNLDRTAIRKIATFSSGIRKCPGEKFAFHEIFVLLGTFTRLFDFEIDNPPRDMQPSPGLTAQPKKYTITVNTVESNNNV